MNLRSSVTSVSSSMLYLYFKVEPSVDEDADLLLAKLEKISPQFMTLFSAELHDLKKTIQYANMAGVIRPIYFHPLMLGSCSTCFKDGVCFQVVKRGKLHDILAVGGR